MSGTEIDGGRSATQVRLGNLRARADPHFEAPNSKSSPRTRELRRKACVCGKLEDRYRRSAHEQGKTVARGSHRTDLDMTSRSALANLGTKPEGTDGNWEAHARAATDDRVSATRYFPAAWLLPACLSWWAAVPQVNVCVNRPLYYKFQAVTSSGLTSLSCVFHNPEGVFHAEADAETALQDSSDQQKPAEHGGPS